jgi:NADPH-dependent curcumin reductase CurA
MGKLKYRVDRADGLRAAPTALGKLFTGGNIGKLAVKVSEEP